MTLQKLSIESSQQLLIVLLSIIAFTVNIFAADGDLDPSFDGDGIVIVNQNSTAFAEELTDSIVQPDGKIVVVGIELDNSSGSNQSQFLLYRLNLDGSLDSGFGTGGRMTVALSALNLNVVNGPRVVIQLDGKILIGGTENAGKLILARLNPNGSPDQTFDGDGRVEATGFAGFGALALDSQTGKIYAGGKGILLTPPQFPGAFTINRFNLNGSPDTTFDGDGRVQTSLGIDPSNNGNNVNDLAIQSDGKIVAVGEVSVVEGRRDFAVLRYTANGALDTSFDGDGYVTTSFSNESASAHAIALQTDGKIVITGKPQLSSANINIIRYTPNGALDTAFGTGGRALNIGSTGNFSSIAIQGDGKILFAGNKLVLNPTSQLVFFVGRLTAGGVLDTTFSDDGSTTTLVGNDAQPRSIALQPDGKIVVSGITTSSNQTTSKKFLVVRYLNTPGSPTVANPALRIADFDGDGKTDASVFRNGTWFINPSTAPSLAPSGFYGVQFGLATDKLAPADYDGDGKTDIALWRESERNFYILNSSNGVVRVENFGLVGDVLTVGDYDGDGKADLSTYREGVQSTFYYRGSLNNPNGNITFVLWGTTGDKAVRGDFDGDGKLDAAVYRGSNQIWYIRNSSTGQATYTTFGSSSDKRISGDFDGDGKTDICVFRDGVWYILQSSNSQIRYQNWGLNTDTIAAGDYDGDGKTDVAVWRNGIYYILQTTNSQADYRYFGTTGDTPIASAFVR